MSSSFLGISVFADTQTSSAAGDWTLRIDPLPTYKVDSASGVRLHLADGREIIDGMSSCKRLLRFTDRSIESIAQECGLEDANYFSRLFKKVEGIPPGEYRRQW